MSVRRHPFLASLIAGAVCFGAGVADVDAAAAKQRRARSRAPAKPIEILAPVGAGTHDLRAAEAARAAIGRRRNVAVIAMDPWSGRVMTVGNPESALSNAYQPCSVFKLAVALAGLERGVIQPETRFNCTRGCWISPGHGPIDLRRALAVSCNPYFEWIGEQVGFDAVVDAGRRLGLGQATGVNLLGESAGALPARPPRQGVGHMSSHGAGVKTTALQLGVLMAALVNGGRVVTPRLASETEPLAIPVAGAAPSARVAPPGLISLLQPGLFSAVTEGSAQKAFAPDFIATGKTGSCSGVGWFASSLGYPRAEMVVVTLVRGGNGSAASTVAGDFYRHLLGRTPDVAVASY
jgi:cell division protein FtsI/penicillin-binding protein 2